MLEAEHRLRLGKKTGFKIRTKATGATGADGRWMVANDTPKESTHTYSKTSRGANGNATFTFLNGNI